ncbi:uncharacterized protein Z520_09525 [Fonsecaea multimorphosa CBS 102226]|uniref:NAD-dependent epimerase/dehydratase domain-containing protein n=1 Tax=Fonsecaea multimorphosa CBS 102226 TaxID=1442371 RepID=A0A0D2GZ76_9EURO|nr:uncharacterized protein Z520_09525 [Fonsecaea multimorphosa CBS 102226]KIX94835.1 hypothetical protein Z520_09525 [Fonsecaea multimorphosa CBS 102226]OAL20413.1 hypothetical protein AYO22_08907 [Fonsecaea multimorphosa]
MSATTMKTAIVTGGCGGIGFGLVSHLLSKPDWRVVIADIRADAYTAISASLAREGHSDRVLFVATDVGSWDSQASLFKQAWEWSGGRVDFFAANAGTAEREHIALANPLAAAADDAEPTPPPLLCTQVNQIGVFYGLKLFVHYARRTAKALHLQYSSAAATNGIDPAPHNPSSFLSPSAAAASSLGYHPKMVITSSCAGLYPFPIAPEYSATKHAVLALTRSVGPVLYSTDNIAVNCINPAYVDTNLTPSELTAQWPPQWITPISTMVRAYDELISETGQVVQDGKSNGEDGVVKTGQSVECVVDKLFYRRPVEYADESQRFLIEQAFDLKEGLWWKGARKMFETFAKQQQQQQ